MLDLSRLFRAGLCPDPRLDPASWAAERRVLTTAETVTPGPWSNARRPYLIEPMQRLALHDPCPSVVLMFAAQSAKSECGLNWLGYVIDHAPCATMIVQPTGHMAEKFSKQRIYHLLQCGALAGKVSEEKSRSGDNTLTEKMFPGGLLVLIGANSPVPLAGTPIRCLFADEVDRYPVSAGKEGDPLELARMRLSGSGERAKELITSTPTITHRSRIATAYAASSQARWEMPCPQCGEYQDLEWRGPGGEHRLFWDGDPGVDPFRSWYVCRVNGCVIEEHSKGAMLAAGRWVHEHPERRVKGYRINALASPLGATSWRMIIGEWLAASARAKVGDTSALQIFVNTRLAETWEETGQQVDAGSVAGRCEDWGPLVPAGVRVLTAGVDVQDDRIELEIVGWGLGMESWSLAYHVVQSDPLDAGTWRALDAVLLRDWPGADGRTHKIGAACIDSGYRSQAVYDYVRDRGRWRVYATKGSAGRRPIWDRKVRKAGKNKDKGVFFLVGVDTAKDSLAAYLRVLQPGPGYCHFPTCRQQEMPDYFTQLASEQRMKRKDRRGHDVWEWCKIADGRRNEALDCFDVETEVLTKGGWRAFAALDGSELLATVNLADRHIEYQRPQALISRQHDGEMVSLKGRRIDILVTPEHRMVTLKKVFDRKSRRWSFDVPPAITLAKDLTVHHSLMASADWRGNPSPSVEIPASRKAQFSQPVIEPERIIDTGDWADFLGWYVSEGCCAAPRSRTQNGLRRRVQLDQNEGPKAEKIRATLSRLPWHFKEIQGHGDVAVRWICTSKQLFDAVQECGVGVASKQVPAWVKEARPAVIRRFLASAILGDGWVQTKPGQREHRTYATISRRLADDIQELFIKIGCSANLKVVLGKPWHMHGRSGSNAQVQYHVSECKAERVYLDGGGNGRRGYIGRTVQYSGMVYCATVPNGTLICRRRGKSFIAGNCRTYALAAVHSLMVGGLRMDAPRPPSETIRREEPAPSVATYPPDTAPVASSPTARQAPPPPRTQAHPAPDRPRTWTSQRPWRW